MTLVWGDEKWLTVAAPVVGVLLLLMIWGYWRARSQRWVRIVAPALKICGILILALCLLEPLFSSTRARPGANLFIVLADNSQSMTLRDRDADQTRAQQLKSMVAKDSPWLTRIGQDFDLRQYAFDTQLRAEDDLSKLACDGAGSNLGGSLQRLLRQYHGRPLAGIILLTDGTATDADTVNQLLSSADGQKIPPIYPVLLGRDTPADDVNLQSIAVSQTNFEDSPVTLKAQVATSGYAGKTIAAEVLDESGKSIQTQKLEVDPSGQPLTLRFRVKPEHAGVSFYRVRVAPDGQLAQLDHPPKDSAEATLANNTRLVAVDRGKGPYRVLYVAGRPNWEYKFLNRAVQSDDQVQLVGLIRIAKREPKFNYINEGERANPLFRGFETPDKEDLEEYDQPVMIPLNTDRDEFNKLRAGFPQTAAELDKFDAIILDDLESEFFKPDQMLLVKDFVSQRGGGLLMLGGLESFRNGKYDRTPIGDLLPVYLDDVPGLPAGARFRLALTREGLLSPWVRLRPDEEAERQRLKSMPSFQVLNSIRGIKPGATILATAQVFPGDTFEGAGTTVPALVEQRFGRGRVGAMLIGDLWRWTLQRPQDAPDDLPKAWRQTIRWLVGDVPRRIEMTVEPRQDPDDPEGTRVLAVRVRDPVFLPQDNATVSLHITTPDGHSLDLPAEPAAREAGLYEAVYVPRQSGAYLAQASAAAPDGSDIGKVQAGWTSDPSADEFNDLRPNRALLDRIAQVTGGQTVAPQDLSSFASTLPTRHADITEPYIRPAWHQPWVIALAIACLAAEWGLRRWKGLP